MGLSKASSPLHGCSHSALQGITRRKCVDLPLKVPLQRVGSFVTCATGTKGTNDGEGSPAAGGGDKKVQDALVQMAQIETQKVRVSEFVDEKAKRLTEIAKQADEEYARIAAQASQGLDAATSKMMKEMDEDTKAFEEELKSARAEIEAQEKELDRFERAVEDARSEGLFFKSLYRGKASPKWADLSEDDQHAIIAKVEDVKATAKQEAGSQGRRVAYAGLAVVVGATIAQGLLSPDEGTVKWPQLGVYGVIELFLILQLLFEGGQIGGDPSKRK